MKFKILCLSMTLAILGWAQGEQQTAGEQAQQDPPSAEAPPPRAFPLEVAGYINFRYLNDDALQKHQFLSFILR